MADRVTVATGPRMLEEGMSLVQRVDWPTAVADGVAGLAATTARPSRACSSSLPG